MYDFNFTDKKNIIKNPEKFLIFVKRLLPRWANGIPDYECIAIFKVLKKLKKKNKKKLVLLETGCGASTIAMYLHCSLYGGKIYSWDINPSKGFFLRSVIMDAVDRILGTSVQKIWTFIPYDSTDKYIGLEVLKEFKIKANFCFFDSLHTLDHLMKELKCFEKVASNEFMLALDDAYYRKKNKNYSYLNMIRKKINLKPISEPKENVCLPFYIYIKKYLKKKYSKVVLENNFYKKNYKNDIFFNYYRYDKSFLNKMGMEEKNKLKNRFEVFYVEK